MTWHPFIPPCFRNRIVCGDSRELAAWLPDESIDVVFSDPVYDRIEDYVWLAKTALRVLKPDRPLIVFCSKSKLAELQVRMSEYLKWQTILFYTVVAKNVRPYYPAGIMSWTTPALVFVKGKYQCQPFMVDTHIEGGGPQSKFKWQKNTAVAIRWLRHFNKHKGIVYDPFAGAGGTLVAAQTLGYDWIASEIDPERAARANQRVRATPYIPSLLPEPEWDTYELPE